MARKVLYRLGVVVTLCTFLGLTLFFVSQQYQDNILFFMTPSEVAAHPNKASIKLRLGGQVKPGSIQIVSQENHVLRFVVTDGDHEMTVDYRGFLPDLFREGQGIVAEGTFEVQTKVFQARRVLAKHDETYRPPTQSSAKKKGKL